MKKYVPFIFFLFLHSFASFSQEIKPDKKQRWGISASANYTFSGIGFIFNIEWQNASNVFYTGPKIPASKTYLAFKGPCGWNIGYRRSYIKNPDKKIRFFFNTDYQITGSKAFSQTEKSEKRNFIHELFIGYGAEYKFTEHLFLGNVIGIGGHLESYYNVDLKWRQTYGGYNNLLKFYLNYKI